MKPSISTCFLILSGGVSPAGSVIPIKRPHPVIDMYVNVYGFCWSIPRNNIDALFRKKPSQNEQPRIILLTQCNPCRLLSSLRHFVDFDTGAIKPFDTQESILWNNKSSRQNHFSTYQVNISKIRLFIHYFTTVVGTSLPVKGSENAIAYNQCTKRTYTTYANVLSSGHCYLTFSLSDPSKAWEVYR